jgi:hypothetical protein
MESGATASTKILLGMAIISAKIAPITPGLSKISTLDSPLILLWRERIDNENIPSRLRIFPSSMPFQPGLVSVSGDYV